MKIKRLKYDPSKDPLDYISDEIGPNIFDPFQEVHFNVLMDQINTSTGWSEIGLRPAVYPTITPITIITAPPNGPNDISDDTDLTFGSGNGPKVEKLACQKNKSVSHTHVFRFRRILLIYFIYINKFPTKNKDTQKCFMQKIRM